MAKLIGKALCVEIMFANGKSRHPAVAIIESRIRMGFQPNLSMTKIPKTDSISANEINIAFK